MLQGNNKKVVVSIGLTMLMVLLGAVAVVTALRLQQLATQPVAPNVPQSQPRANEPTLTPTPTPNPLACVMQFNVPESACKGWCDDNDDCQDTFECYKNPSTAEAGVCVKTTDECEPEEQNATCGCPAEGIVSCQGKTAYRDVSTNTAGTYDLSDTNKLPANANVAQNQQLVYAVTLTSTQTTGSATIEDTLPATLTFIDAQSGCTATGQKVTCTYEGVIPKTFAYRVRVNNNIVSSVDITNTAKVIDAEGEEDTCSTTVKMVVGPTGTPNPTATPTPPASTATPTPTRTHLACVNQACQAVSGAGNNLCNNDEDCANETHMACVNQSCQEVDGGGANTCDSSSDCLQATPVPTVVPPDLPQAGGLTPTLGVVVIGAVLLLVGIAGLLVW